MLLAKVIFVMPFALFMVFPEVIIWLKLSVKNGLKEVFFNGVRIPDHVVPLALLAPVLGLLLNLDAGVHGVVLDSQMLLMDEVRLPDALRTLISRLAGSETVACGDGERGLYARILVRPRPGELQVYKGAAWTQPAPDLVQRHFQQDIRQPEFWQASLDIVDRSVGQLEALA